MMKENKTPKILVTGATGLVGSHLVESLIRRGHPVACLVRDRSQLKWIEGLDVELRKGDCSLPETLGHAVKNAEVIFHAAGLTKAKRAREYYEVNHVGTRNILEACSQHNPGLKKFILVSSLAAAGPSPDGIPVKDTDKPKPVSDYGMSKLLAEEEALRYRDRFPVVILRPSAVYGPRDRDMFELFRWASRGLMIEMTGGERFIELCYIGDLTSALLLAMERDVPSGSIYCVAEDKAYSWAEFREALFIAGGVKAKTIKIPYGVASCIGLMAEVWGIVKKKPALTSRQKIREASQKYWVCDHTKIARDLGFQYHYPLHTGLELTWKWYRENDWV